MRRIRPLESQLCPWPCPTRNGPIIRLVCALAGVILGLARENDKPLRHSFGAGRKVSVDLQLMNKGSDTPVRKKRWRRWGWWAFIAVNVGCLFLILPLLKAVFPLLGIWWNTHSLANFRSHQQKLAQSAQVTPAHPAKDPSMAAESATDSGQALDGLTNQLHVVEKLSSRDLASIIASRFGAKKTVTGDPSQFDEASAVFDNIASTNLVIGGTNYYCYRVDLVDQHGNHKINYDCFKEPNLDYERSKATMELVNRTPQLRKIYDAMAYVLAEKSTAATNAPTANQLPEFRLDKDPSKQP